MPPEKQREFLEIMMKDASRLQRLINSILEISAQEKKKSLKDYQVYRADHLLRSILEESLDRFRIKKENYTISGEAPCEIVAVKDSLKIVFDNLVDNSAKYSVNDSRINIKLACNPGKVLIDFADKGIGIPPKERKKIFRKFYRIMNKDIPNVKGTGLGLYQVKQIIKLHGGKINLIDSGKDGGCVFRIELPPYHSSKKRFKKAIGQHATNG